MGQAWPCAGCLGAPRFSAPLGKYSFIGWRPSVSVQESPLAACRLDGAGAPWPPKAETLTIWPFRGNVGRPTAALAERQALVASAGLGVGSEAAVGTEGWALPAQPARFPNSLPGPFSLGQHPLQRAEGRGRAPCGRGVAAARGQPGSLGLRRVRLLPLRLAPGPGPGHAEDGAARAGRWVAWAGA